ncbi:MAG: hypothetical protein FJZ95_04860 [Chloroflexi bacterium]|nr:hypothetical protein [Chloroflexota bacterium]
MNGLGMYPKRIFPIIPFLLLLLTALTPAPASAAGIGVAPGRIEFAGNSPEATLYVINTGQTLATYQVYTEDEFAGWFQISPARFPLAPNENMAVRITLSPSVIAASEHAPEILVVAFENSAQGEIGAGVKVPVHMALSPLTSEPGTVPEPSAVAVALLEPVTAEGPAPTPEESPTRIPLWIGSAVIMVALLGTLVVIVRRRKNGGASSS